MIVTVAADFPVRTASLTSSALQQAGHWPAQRSRLGGKVAPKLRGQCHTGSVAQAWPAQAGIRACQAFYAGRASCGFV